MLKIAGLWMFGLSEKNVDSALRYLSDLGFKGIILPALGNGKLISTSKEYWLNVYLCVKAFALEEGLKDSKYYVQDILGRPRI